MKLTASLLALAVGLTPVFAVVPEWGQCGGIGYTGETSKWTSHRMVLQSVLTFLIPLACASGTTCVKSNDYYSQCLAGSAGTTTVAGTTTAATTAAPAATGYVGVSGQRFTLNGAKYTVVGFVKLLRPR